VAGPCELPAARPCGFLRRAPAASSGVPLRLPPARPCELQPARPCKLSPAHPVRSVFPTTEPLLPSSLRLLGSPSDSHALFPCHQPHAVCQAAGRALLPPPPAARCFSRRQPRAAPAAAGRWLILPQPAGRCFSRSRSRAAPPAAGRLLLPATGGLPAAGSSAREGVVVFGSAVCSSFSPLCRF
jgi:hypothetical protein